MVTGTGDAEATRSPDDENLGSPQLTDSELSGAPTDVEALLGRALRREEASAWEAMSPSLRRRARERVELMRRWTEDRAGLTAADAADIAKVKPKRFYEMASAWKKDPGLAAVGAYATAPIERQPRIDPRVNAALQANVAAVVAAHQQESVETLRRLLEDVARSELDQIEGGSELKLPSPNVTRAVIERELHRAREMRLLGESVVLDCCATTMRRPDGSPHVLFSIIDRGTRRIMGHALGSIEASVEGYARAAAAALNAIEASPPGALPWATEARRFDVVVGRDAQVWDDLLGFWRRGAGMPDVGTIVNERRFGSQYRKFVGDRVGRIVFRPTWTTAPAAAEAGGEVFTETEAADRAALEVASYNETQALAPDLPHRDEPPRALEAALRLLSEPRV